MFSYIICMHDLLNILLYTLSNRKYECESIGALVKFTDTQRLCLCTPLHNEAMHAYLLMIHTLEFTEILFPYFIRIAIC